MLMKGLVVLKVLADKGLLPPMVRRMVIDIPFDNVVKVYYECCGDIAKLPADLLQVLLSQGQMIHGEPSDHDKP